MAGPPGYRPSDRLKAALPPPSIGVICGLMRWRRSHRIPTVPSIPGLHSAKGRVYHQSETMPVTPENLRAFLARDWEAARASKDRALGAFVQAKGATAAFRLGQALLDQVWPRIGATRSSGVAGLIELRRKLDRANAGRPDAAAKNRRRPEAATSAVVRLRGSSRRGGRGRPSHR